MKRYTVLVFLFIISKILTAQDDFYHPDAVREIRITFAQQNWDKLLDSLFVAGEEGRLDASITIDGTTLNNVGVRYKGYSSVSVDRTKNPFNIKLDYLIEGQNYMGYNKIKLSNVIHDPSFIREVLSYEIARKYMPASRANYALLYINDELMGIYTNVEAVNKDFTEKNYGSRNNSFFKCNPEDLDYPFGDNSNLAYVHGDDTLNYAPYYSLESDSGWGDLLDLIIALDTCTNTKGLEQYLNIDRTLWMHALNYVLVNLDSYIAYSQNYYLYQDKFGRFNPILWDLNMSFGSFRHSDGSEYYDGLTIRNAQMLDPLTHYNTYSVSPRPLMRNLFENDTYRRMYLAHIRTILNENFVSNEYYSRAVEIREKIDSYVKDDPNKFYSYDDFLSNLNNTATYELEYPGITELMDERITYLSSYTGISTSPEISNILSSTDDLKPNDTVYITADISNANNVILAYRPNTNTLFSKVSMLDDGNNNDGASDDGNYGVKLISSGSIIQYYIYAENDTSGIFSPERAEYEFHTIQGEGIIDEGSIVINEFMASIQSVAYDLNNVGDDWIELYNNTDEDISMFGLYLSDNESNITKWAFPDTVIKANGFLIIWADEDGSQEGLHANFRLSQYGEEIFLADSNSIIIDYVDYNYQSNGNSYGRFPDGTGSFEILEPTFSNNNELATMIEEEISKREEIKIYPNPTNNELNIKINHDNVHGVVQIVCLEGRIMTQESIKTNEYSFDVSGYQPGVYLVKYYSSAGVETKKLIIY